MDVDQNVLKWESKPGKQVAGGQLTNFFTELNKVKNNNNQSKTSLVDSFASGEELELSDESVLTDGFSHSVGRTLKKIKYPGDKF